MKRVFVFGSNKAGRHGKGAALHAKQKWGAQEGVGEGRTGFAYAIPTKYESKTQFYAWGKPKLLTRKLHRIERAVDRFIVYAIMNKKTVFLVTEIGCGHAGYKPYEIAPLFERAVRCGNVFLPQRFCDILNLFEEHVSFNNKGVLVYKEYKQ